MTTLAPRRADPLQQRPTALAVWGMLGLRSALAVGLQALLAALFAAAGTGDAWRAAADWWLATFALASVVNLLVLRAVLAREGTTWRDLYGLSLPPERRRGELRWALLGFVAAGPLVLGPNLLLGAWLWGTAQVGADLMYRPLPLWGAVAVFAFPVVHALAELPTYYGYVLPRLTARYGWHARALLVTAAALALQHVFIPMLVDWRYLLWRGLMFLPFALALGFVVQRRPSSLRFLVAAHVLMDLSLPVMVLLAST